MNVSVGVSDVKEKEWLNEMSAVYGVVSFAGK